MLAEARAEIDSEFGAAVSEIDAVYDSVRAGQDLPSGLHRDIGAVQADPTTMLDLLETPH